MNFGNIAKYLQVRVGLGMVRGWSGEGRGKVRGPEGSGSDGQQAVFKTFLMF